MSTHISKSQFKPKALEYLRQVEMQQEAIIITHNKVPVAEILPYQKNTEVALQELGQAVVAFRKPLDPVGVEDWEILQ
ncbi:type II toxin-antitoxin system Phd/YefM family antitoxin [Candidatus Woesebacteria bacterium]|nr:type II toxin-antitoxin system Phd/YefM family antitoxin [Candidatus Woesebacteria bacterium]